MFFNRFNCNSNFVASESVSKDLLKISFQGPLPLVDKVCPEDTWLFIELPRYDRLYKPLQNITARFLLIIGGSHKGCIMPMQNFLSQACKTLLGNTTELTHFKPLSGGCINDAFRVTTNEGQYFVKVNTQSTGHMFIAEVKGLHLLREAAASHLKVPAVAGLYAGDDYECLVMEYIAPAKETTAYWQALGHGMALLHKNTHPAFGLDHDNYLGSLPQENTPHSRWIDFYIQCRLQPMFETGRASGLLPAALTPHFERLCNSLNDLLPEEAPALLHGDLWGGNCLPTENGQACIIDPAVYYGHREADIAMTLLFDRFPARFYEAYSEIYPLLPGWQQRMEIYHLYYLLAHVNLFGASYVGQTVQVLKKY